MSPKSESPCAASEIRNHALDRNRTDVRGWSHDGSGAPGRRVVRRRLGLVRRVGGDGLLPASHDRRRGAEGDVADAARGRPRTAGIDRRARAHRARRAGRLPPGRRSHRGLRRRAALRRRRRVRRRRVLGRLPAGGAPRARALGGRAGLAVLRGPADRDGSHTRVDLPVVQGCAATGPDQSGPLHRAGRQDPVRRGRRGVDGHRARRSAQGTAYDRGRVRSGVHGARGEVRPGRRRPHPTSACDAPRECASAR